LQANPHTHITLMAFCRLAEIFSAVGFNKSLPEYADEVAELSQISASLKHKNGWFTEEQVQSALRALAYMCEAPKLKNWADSYQIPEVLQPKRIALIMAGNIPLSGFHDLLCVLMSGHIAVVKTSSKDEVLPLWIKNFFEKHFPQVAGRMIIEQNLIRGIDAVIATGSNNSSRYFNYYFGKYPHIIRNNRNSVAVLSGNETEEDLKNLADDVFLYFGLGCRSISKVYIPIDYNAEALFAAFNKYEHYRFHNKFANNYDYRKAIYLMNGEPFTDGHFYIWRQAASLHSDVGVLHYEFYKTQKAVWQEIESLSHEVQCVVCSETVHAKAIRPGKAQFPELTDYADDIDTMNFLLSL